MEGTEKTGEEDEEMKTKRYIVMTKRTNDKGYIDLPEGFIPFQFKYVLVGAKTFLEVHYLQPVKGKGKK